MKLQVHVAFCHLDKTLEVRAGFIGREFEGTVTKVVRRGNITLGLCSDNRPAYIRIREAQNLDGRFADLAVAIGLRRAASARDMAHVAKKCLNLMRDMTERYIGKLIKEQFDMKPEDAKVEVCSV